MPRVNSKKFFQEQTAHSLVKAVVVQKYVLAWLDIVTGFQRNNDVLAEAAYIDLFSGPGTYEDGNRSTPLLVIEQVLKKPQRTAALHTYFNDINPSFAKSLQQEVSNFPGFEKLRHKPKFSSESASISLIEGLDVSSNVPQFYFLDQFGYSDVSPEIIRRIFRARMCDCTFFFRTSRVVAAINNTKSENVLSSLFGLQRFSKLKRDFENRNVDREGALLAALKEVMKDAGAPYFLEFPFRIHEDGSSKHHLIYLGKHPKGFELMKEIMARNSSTFHKGVPVIGYTEVPKSGLLFVEDPISALEKILLTKYSGTTKTVGDIFEADHLSNSRFILQNYQEAFRRLEERGTVSANPPARSRKPHNGKVTMGTSVEITFRDEVMT